MRRHLAGILALLGGVFLISLQDVIIKSVSASYAVSMAILLRSVTAFFVLLVIIHFESGLASLKTLRLKLLIARGSILLLAYTAYYLSIAALPLAEAIALFFMAPLLVTILSGPLLGEHVRPSAWAAAALGLAGVFLILRPGSALFEPAAVLSLFSALAYAYGMILARRYGRDTPASVMAFYQNCTYIAVSAGFALIVSQLGEQQWGHPSLAFLFRPWVTPDAHDLAVLLGSGIIAALAVVLLTHAYKRAPASIVAPFEYTGMLWAAFWGFSIFGEVPQARSFVGMGLIALAGLLALQAGRKAHAKEASA